MLNLGVKEATRSVNGVRPLGETEFEERVGTIQNVALHAT